MNDADLIARAKLLKTLNRKNKLAIMHRRARLAEIRAEMGIESLPTPRNFPTRYKYG